VDEYDLLFEGSGGEPAILGLEELFGLLRGYRSGNRQTALSFIGRDPDFLQRPKWAASRNPMLNWVIPCWVGPLEPDEADGLLQKLGRRVLLDVGTTNQSDSTTLDWWSSAIAASVRFALLALARAGHGEQLPVPTDNFHTAAIRLFLERDAVTTNCREVFPPVGLTLSTSGQAAD